ncbi:hypothetical protein KQI52_07655 [bacterium]|nr:hypothetical protein [bacterium]
MKKMMVIVTGPLILMVAQASAEQLPWSSGVWIDPPDDYDMISIPYFDSEPPNPPPVDIYGYCNTYIGGDENDEASVRVIVSQSSYIIHDTDEVDVHDEWEFATTNTLHGWMRISWLSGRWDVTYAWCDIDLVRN